MIKIAYSKTERRPTSIFAISISLLVLIIFSIVSALITFYIDLEILYIFGIPMDFRMFIYGIFTIIYGIFIFQLIRLTGIIKTKTKKGSKKER